VTPADQATWNDLLGTSPLPKASQLLVESATHQPISNKDALSLLDVLANKGAIIADNQLRGRFTGEGSDFHPFSHHRG
jgi:hypothetical protein